MNSLYKEVKMSENSFLRICSKTKYAFLFNTENKDFFIFPPPISSATEIELSMMIKKLTANHQPIKNTDQNLIRSLHIHITNNCNLSCIHCWLPSHIDKSIYTSLDNKQIVDFIDNLIPIGLASIRITGGEPFLKKELFKLLYEIEKRNIKIYIDTNGTLVDEDTVKEIKRYNLLFSVSLDSHLPELHNKIRNSPFAYEKTLNTIRLFKENNIKFNITTVLNKYNYHLLSDFIDFCISKEIQFVKINPVLPFGFSADQKEMVVSDEDVCNLSNIVINKKGIKINPSLPFALFPLNFIYEHYDEKLCDFLGILSLLPDGNISICGAGYYHKSIVLGNILEIKNYKEFWECNPFLLKIRESIPEELTGICQSCVFIKPCLGYCRAWVYSLSNSFTDPYPTCKYLHENNRFPEIYQWR